MDDALAIAAEVVVEVGKVRADRGEGLAGGASVHESSSAGVGRGRCHRAMVERQIEELGRVEAA
jgi:hypothetical protein